MSSVTMQQVFEQINKSPEHGNSTSDRQIQKINNRFNKLSDRSIWFEAKNILRAIHWTYALRVLLNSFGLKHIEETRFEKPENATNN